MRTNLTPATARNCFVASVIIALCGATIAAAGRAELRKAR